MGDWVMLDSVGRGRLRTAGGSLGGDEKALPDAGGVDGVVRDARTQWTVKGIDKRTLELSRLAARKRGMTFGAWVNQVLRNAASEDNSSPRRAPEELMAKIAEIEFKIEQSVGELKEQTSHLQHDVRVLHMLVPKSGG